MNDEKEQAAPPTSGGPGEWVKANEGMPEQSHRYQAQVTGAPEGYVYRVKLGDKYVKFDGFDGGVLIETKSTGYAQWITTKLHSGPVDARNCAAPGTLLARKESHRASCTSMRRRAWRRVP